MECSIANYALQVILSGTVVHVTKALKMSVKKKKKVDVKRPRSTWLNMRRDSILSFQCLAYVSFNLF